MTHNQRRGLNHSISAALALTRPQDDLFIKQMLLEAANFLFELQARDPIEASLLDVSWFLGVDDPWSKK